MSKSFSKLNLISTKTTWQNMQYNSTFYFGRSKIIPKTILRRNVIVYNGKKYVKFHLRKHLLGHKFGEFSITKLLGREIAARIREKQKSKNRNKRKKK